MIQLKVCIFTSSMKEVDQLLTALQTMLNCIDNSGAAIVECVQVMKMKRHAKIGIALPATSPSSDIY